MAHNICCSVGYGRVLVLRREFNVSSAYPGPSPVFCTTNRRQILGPHGIATEARRLESMEIPLAMRYLSNTCRHCEDKSRVEGEI